MKIEKFKSFHPKIEEIFRPLKKNAVRGDGSCIGGTGVSLTGCSRNTEDCRQCFYK